MSILIKGAKVPSGCRMCEYKEWIVEVRSWICPFRHKFVSNSVLKGGKRYSDCPLVEIPPHGDLIDRDKLKNDIPETDADCFENCRDCTLLHQEDVWDIIDDVPTVIESEEQENE